MDPPPPVKIALELQFTGCKLKVATVSKIKPN